jgi:predicted transposase/invertase (TIGR01784 family)
LFNEQTPPKIKKWLELIEDSLDGKLEENDYSEQTFAAVLKMIYRQNIDRELLAQIKDETAWENVKRRQREEGFEEGEKNKAIETARKMLNRGFSSEQITELTGLTLDELRTIV